MQLRVARHTERLDDSVRFSVTFEDPDGFRVVLVPDRWDLSS